MYKVGEAAALSGVTVRALPHYDAIGLLRPSTRSDADYRLYGNDDIRALRRIRRYQALGFSLEEILELLAASGQDRLAVLRKQRDAIRQHAAETAGVVRAINREITVENGGGTEPPDRLGRAEALVSEYLERSKSEGVPQQSTLLAEALDLLRPLVTGVHERRVGQTRRLDTRPSPRLGESGRSVPTVPGSDGGLGGPGVRCARSGRGADDARAPRGGGRRTPGAHRGGHGSPPAGWVALFQAVDAGLKATAENRESRYELLHTAVMLMGADHDAYASDIEALTQRMADIIAEDPDWSERLWAEQRFEQQKVGNAVRRGDPDAVTEAVTASRSFLESCDWPAQRIGGAYSNLAPQTPRGRLAPAPTAPGRRRICRYRGKADGLLGAIMHWENGHGWRSIASRGRSRSVNSMATGTRGSPRRRWRSARPENA